MLIFYTSDVQGVSLLGQKVCTFKNVIYTTRFPSTNIEYINILDSPLLHTYHHWGSSIFFIFVNQINNKKDVLFQFTLH